MVLIYVIGLCCNKTYDTMTNYDEENDDRDNDGNRDGNDNDNVASGSGSDL